jgi:hypothetical protein
MSTPIKLAPPPTADEQNRQDSVAILRTELERAEAGQVRAVIVITKDADGLWTHHTTGAISVREEIGAIESLKWDRLYRLRD